MDNRLAFIDQASFLGLRATREGTLCQCTWVYERAIDFDGLRRFHRNLGRGLLGRRIECSALPFGRHRWVCSPESADIDIAGTVRPRGDIGAWVDERAQVPIDPQLGPSWHIGVLPLTDGGTGVTLVASHCVADGLGLCGAIAEATKGVTRDIGYPPPRSRTRPRALLEDARQTAQGAPEVARALIAAARLGRRDNRHLARSTAPPAAWTLQPDGDRVVLVPSVTVYIDTDEWDARAKALGGTGNSLFAACAVKLAARAGRVHAGDRAVTLAIPVSDRADDDTRANALSSTSLAVRVDPTLVTADLREIRGKIKQGLLKLQDGPDELLQPLPLTPLVPKWLARKMADAALGSADLPVGCSNLGQIDSAVTRADGTDADYVFVRLAEQGVTKKSLERAGGKLFLSSGRICGKVFITVRAYLPGQENSACNLAVLTSRTLAEFDLTGAIE